MCQGFSHLLEFLQHFELAKSRKKLSMLAATGMSGLSHRKCRHTARQGVGHQSRGTCVGMSVSKTGETYAIVPSFGLRAQIPLHGSYNTAPQKYPPRLSSQTGSDTLKYDTHAPDTPHAL